MKEIKLNGKQMLNPKITHLYLKYNLKLSPYYGANLDALYDELSTMDNSTLIIFEHKEAMLDQLKSYGDALLSTIEDASLSNPNVKVLYK